VHGEVDVEPVQNLAACMKQKILKCLGLVVCLRVISLCTTSVELEDFVVQLFCAHSTMLQSFVLNIDLIYMRHGLHTTRAGCYFEKAFDMRA
jgi:hypothetical protein